MCDFLVWFCFSWLCSANCQLWLHNALSLTWTSLSVFSLLLSMSSVCCKDKRRVLNLPWWEEMLPAWSVIWKSIPSCAKTQTQTPCYFPGNTIRYTLDSSSQVQYCLITLCAIPLSYVDDPGWWSSGIEVNLLLTWLIFQIFLWIILKIL